MPAQLDPALLKSALRGSSLIARREPAQVALVIQLHLLDRILGPRHWRATSVADSSAFAVPLSTPRGPAIDGSVPRGTV
jgi:hypothetical protein